MFFSAFICIIVVTNKKLIYASIHSSSRRWIKGGLLDSKKVKSFNSKEEAFSFLSNKAGRKVGNRED